MESLRRPADCLTQAIDMLTRISVLVPTRGRVGRLRTLLESYDRTTIGVEDASELIFRVDDDDSETQDFLLRTRHRTLIGPRMEGYRSMPQFFNEMYLASSGDMLMCGNDDIIFQTTSWAPLLLAAANEYPDKIFNLAVSTLNEGHHPFCIVSREMVRRMGFYWDPRIFWGDIFLRDVAAWFGRLVPVPHVRIDHDWAGLNPDLTFQETRASKSRIEGDDRYWSAVHAPAVAEAAERIKEMMA